MVNGQETETRILTTTDLKMLQEAGVDVCVTAALDQEALSTDYYFKIPENMVEVSYPVPAKA